MPCPASPRLPRAPFPSTRRVSGFRRFILRRLRWGARIPTGTSSQAGGALKVASGPETASEHGQLLLQPFVTAGAPPAALDAVPSERETCAAGAHLEGGCSGDDGAPAAAVVAAALGLWSESSAFSRPSDGDGVSAPPPASPHIAGILLPASPPVSTADELDGGEDASSWGAGPLPAGPVPGGSGGGAFPFSLPQDCSPGDPQQQQQQARAAPLAGELSGDAPPFHLPSPHAFVAADDWAAAAAAALAAAPDAAAAFAAASGDPAAAASGASAVAFAPSAAEDHDPTPLLLAASASSMFGALEDEEEEAGGGALPPRGSGRAGGITLSAASAAFPAPAQASWAASSPRQLAAAPPVPPPAGPFETLQAQQLQLLRLQAAQAAAEFNLAQQQAAVAAAQKARLQPPAGAYEQPRPPRGDAASLAYGPAGESSLPPLPRESWAAYADSGGDALYEHMPRSSHAEELLHPASSRFAVAPAASFPVPSSSRQQQQQHLYYLQQQQLHHQQLHEQQLHHQQQQQLQQQQAMRLKRQQQQQQQLAMAQAQMQAQAHQQAHAYQVRQLQLRRAHENLALQQEAVRQQMAHANATSAYPPQYMPPHRVAAASGPQGYGGPPVYRSVYGGSVESAAPAAESAAWPGGERATARYPPAPEWASAYPAGGPPPAHRSAAVTRGGVYPPAPPLAASYSLPGRSPPLPLGADGLVSASYYAAGGLPTPASAARPLVGYASAVAAQQHQQQLRDVRDTSAASTMLGRFPVGAAASAATGGAAVLPGRDALLQSRPQPPAVPSSSAGDQWLDLSFLAGLSTTADVPLPTSAPTAAASAQASPASDLPQVVKDALLASGAGGREER